MKNNSDRRWFRKFSVEQWISIILGGLMTVFSGGCSIAILADRFMNGRRSAGLNDFSTVAILGLGPFVFGTIILFFVIKVWRE